MDTRNRAAPGHTGNNSLLGEARRKTLPSKFLTSGLCSCIVLNRHGDAIHAQEKAECFDAFWRSSFLWVRLACCLKENTPHCLEAAAYFMAEIPIVYRETKRTHHTAEAAYRMTRKNEPKKLWGMISSPLKEAALKFFLQTQGNGKRDPCQFGYWGLQLHPAFLGEVPWWTLSRTALI